MSYFTPLLFAVLSFAGICWIIAKKIPILRSLPRNGEFPGYFSGGFFTPLFQKVSGASGKDALIAFFGFLEKRLRRLKIVILKIDNKITALIKNLRDRILHHENAKDDRGENGEESISGGLKTVNPAISGVKQTEIKKGIDGIQIREEQWIEILSKDPANIDAYKELGKIYLLTNRPQEAKETLSFALKLKPGDEEIKRYLERVS